MTNADDEMSASDRILMRALAEAIGGPPPPIDLAARCEGLLAWIDVDSELAMLLDQPVAEAAGTRGAAPSAIDTRVRRRRRQLRDRADTPSDDVLRGQLLGGEAARVVVRTAAGATYLVAGRRVRADSRSAIHHREPMRLELEPEFRKSTYPYRLVRHLANTRHKGKHRHESESPSNPPPATQALAVATIVCGHSE